MKHKIVGLVLAVALLVAATFYITRVPLRKGYLGPVTLTVQRYVTNAPGGVSAMVAITNGGPYTIRFAVGTQKRHNTGWVDSVSGMSNHFNLLLVQDPLLAPHSERVVTVGVPGTSGPWRVYAVCSKEYPEHWSRSLRWMADAYIFKRGVVEHLYSAEISR